MLGWLVTRQAARWVQNDTRAAFTTQQRIMRRLHSKRLIHSRPDRTGRNCYVLSRGGAALLQELMPGAAWHHGHDLSINNLHVQNLIFERCLEERRAGNEVMMRAGMRAHGIVSNADYIVCTEIGNVGVCVERRSSCMYGTGQENIN